MQRSAKELFAKLTAVSLKRTILNEQVDCPSKKIMIPKIVVFNSLDSTNDEAKRLLKQAYLHKQALFPRLIVAKHQTAGRGRNSKSFFSPAESGLYFSYVFPSESFLQPAHLTIATAVSIKRAIQITLGIGLKFKFVNDLILHGLKVGGILVEGQTFSDMNPHQYYIVGCGLNLWPPTGGWPANITIAGNLIDSPKDLPDDLDLNHLLAKCYCSMNDALLELCQDQTHLLAAYASDLLTLTDKAHPLYGDPVITKKYSEGELKLETKNFIYLITKERISKYLAEHVK